jgi:hypothetical protein
MRSQEAGRGPGGRPSSMGGGQGSAARGNPTGWRRPSGPSPRREPGRSGKGRSVASPVARREDSGRRPTVSWGRGWPLGCGGPHRRRSAPIGANPAGMTSRWTPSATPWRRTGRPCSPHGGRSPIARGRGAGCGSRSQRAGHGPWGSRQSGIGWGSRRGSRCGSRSVRRCDQSVVGPWLPGKAGPRGGRGGGTGRAGGG